MFRLGKTRQKQIQPGLKHTKNTNLWSLIRFKKSKKLQGGSKFNLLTDFDMYF